MFKRSGWYWLRFALVAITLFSLLYVLFVLFMERSKTRLAEDFDREKFDKLQLGVTSNAALKVLGQPLSKQVIELPETWLYCLPGLCPSAEDPRSPLKTPAVAFDDRGKVYDPGDMWSHLYQPLPMGLFPPENGDALRAAGITLSKGTSKIEVRERFGEPAAIVPAQAIEWWSYSEPAGTDNNYDEWVIGIGESGRVIGKGHWREYD